MSKQPLQYHKNYVHTLLVGLTFEGVGKSDLWTGKPNDQKNPCLKGQDTGIFSLYSFTLEDRP